MLFGPRSGSRLVRTDLVVVVVQNAFVYYYVCQNDPGILPTACFLCFLSLRWGEGVNGVMKVVCLVWRDGRLKCRQRA